MELYSTGRHAATDIGERMGVSSRTVFRRLKGKSGKSLSDLCFEGDKDVVVLMDTTYWGRNFGVVVMKDNISGRVLWYKYIDRKERISDYEEGIAHIEKQGLKILGVVCDGLKGLKERFLHYPFQLCQFHMAQLIRLKLTRNPKSQAGQELLNLSRKLAHTEKESFVALFRQWETNWKGYVSEMTTGEDGKRHHTHARLWSAYRSLKNNMESLWTFYDHPEAKL